MADAIDNQMQDTQSTEEINPWAAAFEALNNSQQENNQGIEQDNIESSSDARSNTSNFESADNATSDGNNGEYPDANNAEDGNSERNEDSANELDIDTGNDYSEDSETGTDLFGITEDELAEYREGLVQDVRDRAIDEVAQEFIKRGVMHQNGKLGAVVTDSAIMERDDDGVPHFYNPETKREFTGENPRKQAQEWCDEYNKELATVFNDTCEKYVANLMEKQEPYIRTLEFAPVYNNLDPITKAMFDNAIEDYEIIDDDGKIAGYSVDLNKVHAMVQRQVASIQSYGKAQAAAKSSEPTGPALDMKASGVSPQNNGSAPKSLAEAMERLQNKQLEELRRK